MTLDKFRQNFTKVSKDFLSIKEDIKYLDEEISRKFDIEEG